MASSEIKPDGRVVAPLNITNPVPFLNLRGFRWDDKGGAAQQAEDGAEQAAAEHHGDQAPIGAAHAEHSHPPPMGIAGGPGPFGPGGPGPPPPPPLPFPLSQFQGSFAGNGFNMIFRPLASAFKDEDTATTPPKGSDGPTDNILELNLTTEQWTFGQPLGSIPNRGLGPEPDIFLGGLPYLQTVQNVLNRDTGKGDNPEPKDIHFEPGVWLFVPKASFNASDSVVRMASIPHGTTINAQGPVPTKVQGTALGGVSGPPDHDVIDARPFLFGQAGNPFTSGTFKSLDADTPNSLRRPIDLSKFNAKGSGRITTEIIQNPNLILKSVTDTQTITETITFEVATGPPTTKFNGGGTANISFLAGPPKDPKILDAGPGNNPTAHAAFMKSKWWIETVQYQVNIPKMSPKAIILLKPTIPATSLAPTPVFAVTAPAAGVTAPKTVTIPGIQIQYSQTVNLDFFGITWPHVSLASLVPTDPQPFQLA
ncbi:hypothetical protein QBC47DRAFT_312005 [Echria macrotheca]|uniref:Uncharacterized protein n=1 Tax=Echria macrotheca TaxID=438768 RepID=A0AAJ0B1C4_9PEZI|nr:hypothetical protein QBC47DRAFT_312005 [Echria macrotheca]